MTLAPLVPAEPDESVSARVAAICQLKRDFAKEVALSAAWQEFKATVDVCMAVALGLSDDVPTKVEREEVCDGAA